ncbi:MAG: 50S ribosomal protein L37ae [archaeon]
MARTKKTKAAGRFGARYGSKVKEKWNAIISKAKVKQKCPYCKKLTAKRQSKGIFLCKSCKKKFTSSAYFIE